jgi:TrmH family RNA methyltransferase
MSILSSRTHPLVKKWKSLLSDSRKRRELGCFVLEGPRLAKEGLAAGAPLVEAVCTAEFEEDPRNREILKGLRDRRAPIHVLQAKVFDSLADTEEPQGILLVGRMPETGAEKAWLAGPRKLVVAAEGLQDPGNLGTLLRTSWAAGVEGVLLGAGCADPWAPKTLRAGSGAQLQMPVFSGADLPTALAGMKDSGMLSLAAMPGAKKSYLELDYRGPACLVVGSEGQGLSGNLAQACRERVRIPYPGKAESLNVSISASVILFEILRQRS